MSTNLEKYLKENRSGLDVEYPDDDKLWKGISSSQVSQANTIPLNNKKRPGTNLWRIAAIVTLLISLTYITFDSITDRQLKNTPVLSALNNQEVLTAEQDYLRQVRIRENEIREFNIRDNGIITGLFDELLEQDRLLKETLTDINELNDKDQVINTVFKIYERKIELLERIIIETNKTDEYEHNNENNL